MQSAPYGSLICMSSSAGIWFPSRYTETDACTVPNSLQWRFQNHLGLWVSSEEWRPKEKQCQQREPMRADEKGGPTNGQPSTQQNHRLLELERPHRITWPNPLTPILKSSEMWPKSSSSKQARIPRHPTPSPALDYSSFPSFKLKGLREGKIKKGKAKLCSLCIPSP